MIEVLDLFSAAAGGWSLGLHRAGFRTIAACEFVDWRRALYAQNNPGVLIYDDVRTLTADRLLSDLGVLPDIIVGSPPCQDISSANPKGRGVEGERSGLFFEAVRLIGECRPRWFALENSANLRTRGADAVLSALEALDYTCWTFVVRASDIGANHERPRAWLIGCDVEQVSDPDGDRWPTGWSGRGFRGDISAADHSCHAARERHAAWGGDRAGEVTDPESIGHEGGRPWRHWPDGHGQTSIARCDAADAPGERHEAWPGDDEGSRREEHRGRSTDLHASGRANGNTPDPDQARQAHGCMEPGLRQAEIADDGCGDGRSHDGSCAGQMGGCPRAGGDAAEPWADWNGGLAHHLRVDDGISAWVAGTRIAVGGRRGTAAASLIVEAYGDAVVPQIPEAIGRAILRVEAAMSAVLQGAA